MDIRKIVKETTVNVLITALFAFFGSIISYYVFIPDGRLSYSNSISDNNKYTTSFLIRNLNKNEKIKNIEIKFHDDVDIEHIYMNGVEVKDNNIKFNIYPNGTISLYIVSNTKIDNNSYDFVKNGYKIEEDNISNIDVFYIVKLIIIYSLVNFILLMFVKYLIQKRIDKSDRDLNKALERTHELESRYDEIDDRLENMVRKSQLYETIQVREFEILQKQNIAYENIILKMAGSKLTKKELKEMVIETLGSDSITIDHKQYSTLVDILERIVK